MLEYATLACRIIRRHNNLNLFFGNPQIKLLYNIVPQFDSHLLVKSFRTKCKPGKNDELHKKQKKYEFVKRIKSCTIHSKGARSQKSKLSSLHTHQ